MVASNSVTCAKTPITMPSRAKTLANGRAEIPRHEPMLAHGGDQATSRVGATYFGIAYSDKSL